MKTVADELESINLGAPAHFGGLTIFPLFRSDPLPEQPSYALLEDAILTGAARVTELGEGGSVPELRFENLGQRPVLLLDGEELVGAKQNRVLNLTILAPPKQAITIPVSCVEAGRWHAESDACLQAEHVMYSRARAAKAAQVSYAMARSDSRHSDQSAIWDEIALKAESMNASSPTQAMNAIYDSKARSLDSYLDAFACAEGQTGVAFAVDGMTGLDLMDHPHAFRAMFPKLIRSYALDALGAPDSAPIGASEMTNFLAHIGKASCAVRAAIGMGEDLRLTGEDLSGAGLWAEGRYVHLCAFSVNGTGSARQFRTRISRPTHRRP